MSTHLTLVGGLCWALSVAAATAQGLPTPHGSQPAPAFWQGWLHEILDADTAAAAMAYGQPQPTRNGAERIRALGRLAELHRVCGDATRLGLVVARLTEAGATQQHPAAPLPPEDLQFSAAFAASDRNRVEALRALVAKQGRASGSIYTAHWIPLGSRPQGRGRPAGTRRRERGSPTIGDPGLSTTHRWRFKLVLPEQHASSAVLRRRAAELASLRLAGDHQRADRIEHDLVERLREAGWHTMLVAETPKRGAADVTTAAAEVALARAALEQTRVNSVTTKHEAAVLRRVLARLDALPDIAAAELLAKQLPYRIAPKG